MKEWFEAKIRSQIKDTVQDVASYKQTPKNDPYNLLNLGATAIDYFHNWEIK